MQYKIEKGIPAPQTTQKNSYPFREMEVGDSFSIKTRDEMERIRIAAVAHKMRYNAKFAFTIRKNDEGWRLWRIEFVERSPVSEKPVSKLKTA